MIPREVAEAAEYIKRFEKNDHPDALKDFDVSKAGKQVTIDHTGLVNSLVKFICFVRMPELSRSILLTKLSRPGLTNMEIAVHNRMRIVDVDAYEQEGKDRVKSALKSISLQEAINKFNTEATIKSSIENSIKAVKEDDSIGGNRLN